MMRRSNLTPSSRLFLVTSIILNVLLFSALWPLSGGAGFIPDVSGITLAGMGYGGGSTGGRRNDGGRGCTMCGVSPGLCEEVGEVKLEQAIGYSGSNDRLRRLLAKIRAGEPFTMGIIGGSVSQGAGIDWGDGGDEPREPRYRPLNMHRQIFEHLNSLAPHNSFSPSNGETRRGAIDADGMGQVVFGENGKKEGKNGMINGALGGTGSGYFAYCWGEHVDVEVDLVVIELSINDEPQVLQPSLLHPNTGLIISRRLTRNINSYELLVRSLLDLPHKPAVISVEIFALLFSTIAFGGDMHKGINQFYDIPSMSLRNPFLPQVLANFSEVERFFLRAGGEVGKVEGMDLRHLSHYGHRLTADLVKTYIDMQLCEMDRRIPSGAVGGDIQDLYPITDVPKMRLNQKYFADTVVPALRPSCFSMTSPKHKLEPVSHKGWDIWSHGEKVYWRSTSPGSLISFNFMTSIGEVELHYLRSKIFGLGNVWCWVDDQRSSGFRIEGWWDQVYNIAQSSGLRDLNQGDHTLHCEVEEGTADPGGGHEFRIISLTSI